MRICLSVLLSRYNPAGLDALSDHWNRIRHEPSRFLSRCCKDMQLNLHVQAFGHVFFITQWFRISYWVAIHRWIGVDACSCSTWWSGLFHREARPPCRRGWDRPIPVWWFSRSVLSRCCPCCGPCRPYSSEKTTRDKQESTRKRPKKVRCNSQRAAAHKPMFN